MIKPGLPKQQLLRSIDRDIYLLITNLIMLIVCCNVILMITKEEGNLILLINCCGQVNKIQKITNSLFCPNMFILQ